MKEQLRQKAQKMLQENVVDPATTAIEGILGGVLDRQLDGIGLGANHRSKVEDKHSQPTLFKSTQKSARHEERQSLTAEVH